MGMSGKAALTPDHVLCSDQRPASDVDGNNMANIASCNGVGVLVDQLMPCSRS